MKKKQHVSWVSKSNIEILVLRIAVIITYILFDRLSMICYRVRA